MIYSLTVGDWSGDGHDKTVDILFETSYDADQIRELYRQAVDKSGVNFFDRVSSPRTLLEEYEDRYINNEDVDALIQIGVKLPELERDYDNQIYYAVTTEALGNIFLEMVKSQDSKFDYKIVTLPSINLYTLGGCGYGLFE